MSRPTKPIEVQSVYLHQTINWPTVPGGDSKTLNATKIRGLKMFWTPQGLILRLKDKPTCLIPHANIANALITEQDENSEE